MTLMSCATLNPGAFASLSVKGEEHEPNVRSALRCQVWTQAQAYPR
jgi:hypothetical protein